MDNFLHVLFETNSRPQNAEDINLKATLYHSQNKRWIRAVRNLSISQSCHTMPLNSA